MPRQKSVVCTVELKKFNDWIRKNTKKTNDMKPLHLIGALFEHEENYIKISKRFASARIKKIFHKYGL